MGKSIIVKGADFSAVAVVVREKQYVYNIPDSDMSDGEFDVNYGALGFSQVTPAPTQGLTLDGVRADVSAVGTLNIYKASLPNPSSASEMTLVATLNANSLGIQDIDFSEPVTLGANDCLIFGDYKNASGGSLKFTYTRRASSSGWEFYYFAGGADVRTLAGQKMLVDFYTYVDE